MVAFLASLFISRNPALTLSHARRLAKVGLFIGAIVLLAIAVIGFNLWLSGERTEAVENDRARSGAQALGKARTADQEGAEAAQGTLDRVEAGNRAAAEAAAGSEDPLKSGLDALGEDR